MRKKTQVADVNRSLYDIKDEFEYSYKTDGLNEAVVRQISAQKDEPQWMLEFRLKSLDIYHQLDVPPWGPDISGLDIANIITYVKPKADLNVTWDDVPDYIKNTFTRLGSPQAEHKYLAGVGAQYDSEVVYHSMQENFAKQGVVYLDMDTAVKEYEELVRKHFMKCVPPSDHKFAALHGAVWSGGSFVYVPAGVKVEIPLQQ
jgi:Fe-S cluster assembly protein SufB